VQRYAAAHTPGPELSPRWLPAALTASSPRSRVFSASQRPTSTSRPGFTSSPATPRPSSRSSGGGNSARSGGNSARSGGGDRSGAAAASLSPRPTQSPRLAEAAERRSAGPAPPVELSPMPSPRPHDASGGDGFGGGGGSGLERHFPVNGGTRALMLRHATTWEEAGGGAAAGGGGPGSQLPSTALNTPLTARAMPDALAGGSPQLTAATAPSEALAAYYSRAFISSPGLSPGQGGEGGAAAEAQPPSPSAR